MFLRIALPAAGGLMVPFYPDAEEIVTLPGAHRNSDFSPSKIFLWLIFLFVFHCSSAIAQTPHAENCPKEILVPTTCYSGMDSEGAFYRIAIPKAWNQVLVLHAHGGPSEFGPAKASRSEEDLRRWALIPNMGFAWAGSTYRRGGYGVSMAAADTERLRQIFVGNFGQPRRTLLHGQSYGGGVASKAAELYAMVNGKRGPYDGVLLTSGVLGGGVKAYQFRADLRTVFEEVCHNHPLPDEPQYPLWMGLPMESPLTRAELARRVQDCTGVGLPIEARSEIQKVNLSTIARTAKINPETLLSHLTWATWMFQDLTQRRLGGHNPFEPGSDEQAVNELKNDSEPIGQVNVPILTIHAINDPTAFVELESLYRSILEKAGNSELLLQTFTDEATHSYLNDAEYAAAFDSLLDWIDHGEKPSAQSVSDRCKAIESRFAGKCLFNPDYQPVSLDRRPPAQEARAAD